MKHGMYGDIPVTFHQTFLTTRLSDEKLLHNYENKISDFQFLIDKINIP